MASPADVPEAKERTCAWVLYVLLLTTFVGYVAYTIVDGVQQREEPPTSFEREEMAWSLPHIVAEGTRPTFGECTFSLESDDDDTERECNVEFYADEESEEGEEGVLVFFLGDFDISALRDEYEENSEEDDPEFDQSFVEGFVVLGFEEVGDLWETPIGLCSAQEFPAEEDRNFEAITDACPISTYVPIGAVREGQDSQAYASNFVLEAEVFRTLETEEYFSYSSSVSSTIWNIESGSLDDAFSLSVDNKQTALSSKTAKNTPKLNPALTHKEKVSPSSWHHKRPHKLPTPTQSSARDIKLQQDSTALGYAGQVWVYQQSWTVSVTEEQDPLDVLALLGQWGGAFTYVAIVFGVVFTAGKGGVRYNRFSKDSRDKYKRQPASKKGKKDKKKKKKGKKEKEGEESESEEEESDDDGGDDDMDAADV